MGHVPMYFEAAAVIVTLVLLGQVLELRARGRTGAAIQKLLGLAPAPRAASADDGAEEDVRSSRSMSATGCACGRARKFRSTAWSCRAPAPSTSR